MRYLPHVTSTGVLLTLALAAQMAVAQIPGARVPGGCDVPTSQRTSETGCYLIATESLETLPAKEVFWHLYTYPTRDTAETARKASAGIVVESLGKVWLFTI